MKKIKKYFGKINMSWKRVILFAVITGVFTGLIKVVPFLDETSFQDIAIYLDWWFLFAIIVITNCHKWYEAALKCFVFFLISQPLIYLVQVPFYQFGWQIFIYYKHWFNITLLTLPGACIAYLVKRKDWMSVPIIAVPCVYYAWATANFAHSALLHFPNHLLSAICAHILGLVFIFGLIDNKTYRKISLAIYGVLSVAAFAYYFI